MAMTSLYLRAYLAMRYAPLLQEAGATSPLGSDAGTGQMFDLAIDQTLRMLGTAESDLATAVIADGQEQDALALGSYWVCRFLCDQVAVLADVQVDVPGMSRKLSQIYAAAKERLADAQKEIGNRGYGPDTMQYGTLQLDFLEPINGIWPAASIYRIWESS